MYSVFQSNCSPTCGCSSCMRPRRITRTLLAQGIMAAIAQEIEIREDYYAQFGDIPEEDYFTQNKFSGRKARGDNGKGARVRARQQHLWLKKDGRQYCQNKWRRR
ncbi:hypothetical protein GR7B_00217 [Vibrio phage vB_VcorM_GR7B]|nr:hypothetical protein GR7B_00217 [Vibrio phage vB_VcorM_GR7B]